MNRRRFAVTGAAMVSVLGLTAIEALRPSKRLVWNRTESAPIGLYWADQQLPSVDGWALVSGDAGAARWVAAHGFLAAKWPIIKHVRGVSGDEICRRGVQVSVNGVHVADAIERTRTAVELPLWSGCRILVSGEFFLLNDHERSLDGRYFGVTDGNDIEGSLTLLWEAPSWLR